MLFGNKFIHEKQKQIPELKIYWESNENIENRNMYDVTSGFVPQKRHLPYLLLINLVFQLFIHAYEPKWQYFER